MTIKPSNLLAEMYHRTKKTKLQPSTTLSWPHKRLILKIWTVHFMISFIMSFSPSTNNFVWVVWFRIASSCTSMVLRNLSSCLYSASFHISHPCFTPESSATTSPGSRWACFLFLLARVLPLLSSLTRGLSAVRNGSFTLFISFPLRRCHREASGILYSEVEELPSDCISDSTSWLRSASSAVSSWVDSH